MDPDVRDRVTSIVTALDGGDTFSGAAAEELFPLVYNELRRLAQWQMGNDAGQTLQPTALVHEVYLRLVDRATTDWRWGMVIDLDKCVDGCTACLETCRTEHNVALHGDIEEVSSVHHSSPDEADG